MSIDRADANAPKIANDSDTDTLTDNAFLGGKLQLLQPQTGYRAGIDAVLLAATVSQGVLQAGNRPHLLRILDVGAGIGTVGLCVAARITDAEVTLIEKDPLLAQLANRNIERNNFENRVKIINTDIGAPAEIHTRLDLSPESFDIVLANPPFHKTGHGTRSPSNIKSAAHAMPESNLETWIRFMTRMCTPSGTLTLIHKAAALDQILAITRNRFGTINVLPVHPRTSSPAKRVIVTGTKGSRAEMKISQGLVLHAQNNTYMPNVEAILRNGAPLNLLNQ